MPDQKTTIRLIGAQDAAAIAAHRARDAEAFSPWEQEQPGSFSTVQGQAERIARMPEDHRDATTWPGAVLAGQVTVSAIVRQPSLRSRSGTGSAGPGPREPRRGPGPGRDGRRPRPAPG